MDEEVIVVASAKPTMPEKPHLRNDESRTLPFPPPGSYIPPKSPAGLVVTFRKGEPVLLPGPSAGTLQEDHGRIVADGPVTGGIDKVQSALEQNMGDA